MMLRATRRKKRGFTLVEILVSIAIFAIGGVAVLSLFIAMTERQTQAAEITRGTEIANLVRNSITSTLKLPMRRKGDKFYRQISFPFASLDPRIDAREEMSKARDFKGDGGENGALTALASNTFFYELPTVPYTGKSSRAEDGVITSIPYELRDGQLDFVQVGDQRVRTFFVLPGAFNSYRSNLDNPSDVNFDDAGRYAFQVEIRRSVQRNEHNGQLLEGFFTVQVRVYKDYVLGSWQAPIVEETFSVYAADKQKENAGVN